MGNPISHWELMVGDLAKGKEFYSSIFHWEFDETAFPGYSMIKTGTDPGGGMMAKPDMAPASALNTYFQVDDVEVTLAKATAAGATVIAPKTAIPGVGYWAMFADPDGIPIGILQGE
jgi:predicted enzyme related to lactoylglutathione lyase